MAERERIVVAMSGGVDSSVAAGLLVEQGFDVIGISMRLAPDRPAASNGKSSGCCSLEDFRDAGRVADKLGIPHYIFDMRDEFERDVINPFVSEYLAGRTPSPCILCNREIKFSLFHQKAAELGARRVATGHYAQIEERDGRYELRKGRDEGKDQSYFLFEMGQHELETSLFPVGHMTKDEVRGHAERLGLVVAAKPDSQEVCFVPDGRYADFVAKVAPERVKAGKIVAEDGRELGDHEGVHGYTVGQRRGLGVSAPNPLYVSSIDAESGTVRVSERDALAAAGLVADRVHWVSGTPEPLGAPMDVRIRYRHRGVPGTVQSLGEDGSVSIAFDEIEYAVTPGQAVVFYRDDAVVGGAWIRESLPVREEPSEAEPCA